MNIKKLVISSLVLIVIFLSSFFSLRHLSLANSDNEPYSIVIVAGQSWAEGTNSARNNLPDDSNGFYKKHYEPADGATQFWWAGADGKGPRDVFEFLNFFFDGNSPAGWIKSGGQSATGAQRMQTLSDNYQRLGYFGPELGVGRELYDKGRRKTIILKVSYGFQSLAKSSSPFIPYDFNAEPGRNRSYQRMKDEFNELTAYLRSIGKVYTVDGFYWLQGGTDALQNEYADSYLSDFTAFTDAVSTDFQMHPEGRIVVAKMSMKKCLEESYPLTGSYCGFPYAQSIDPLVYSALDVAHSKFAKREKKVREAQQTVADNDINKRVKVDIFDVNDIEMGSDYIHYSRMGNLEVGKRFINMYKLPIRIEGSSDYDGDGVLNNNEDSGRGAGCQLSYQTAGNSNIGDDDSDCDGYPNYLDKINGIGSGISQ